MTFVIAKYKEDISWVNLLNDKVFIINKDPLQNCKYNIDLPNIGRESHSYLTYITKYYEELDDYTCFLQGDPLGHISSIQNILDTIKLPELPNFVPFGLTYAEKKVHNWPLDCVNYTSFEDIVDIPEEIVFKAGAQFVVSKQKIQKHPKEFYEKLLERHNTIVAAPWTMERLWHIIFS